MADSGMACILRISMCDKLLICRCNKSLMHICSIKTVVRTGNNRGVFEPALFPLLLGTSTRLEDGLERKRLDCFWCCGTYGCHADFDSPSNGVKEALLTSLDGSGFAW